jgi:hypothetical protein
MSTDTATWLDESALEWNPRAVARRPSRRRPRHAPRRRVRSAAVAALIAATCGVAAAMLPDSETPRPAERTPASAPAPSSAATLERIAACESNGDPGAVSEDGAYRGKYQFDLPTWHSVGGRGDPALAPEREQDARALRLLETRGLEPWPVCGSS